jgi:protein-S-isoprenylcysteine O-methyltransferase Ste14
MVALIVAVALLLAAAAVVSVGRVRDEERYLASLRREIERAGRRQP